MEISEYSVYILPNIDFLPNTNVSYNAPPQKRCIRIFKETWRQFSLWNFLNGEKYKKVSKQIRYLTWRQKLNDEYCPLNLHRTLNFYEQYSDSKKRWYHSMHWLSQIPSRYFEYVHVKGNMNYIYWMCSPFEFPEDKQR